MKKIAALAFFSVMLYVLTLLVCNRIGCPVERLKTECLSLCLEPAPTQKTSLYHERMKRYYVKDLSYAEKWPVKAWKIRNRSLKAKDINL